MDNAEYQILNNKGVYIKPLYLIESELKRLQLKATLEYELDRINNISKDMLKVEIKLKL